MTQPADLADRIRCCATVAECHALRASLGEMNSATYMALLMRIEALRKWEAANPWEST